MMRPAIRAIIDSPLLRFLIVGGGNTLITGAVVILLSLALPGWTAFTIAFALGIAFSVLLTGRWVFRSHVSPRRAMAYIGSYLVIYLVGLLVVGVLRSWGAPPAANGATVIVTAPLSFLAGKLVFTSPTPKVVTK